MQALKILHNSSEFLPIVIYLALPLPQPEATPTEATPTEASRSSPVQNGASDRTEEIEVIQENGDAKKEENKPKKKELQNGISSTEDDLIHDLELTDAQLESEAIRKEFLKYFDLVFTHQDVNSTFEKIVDSLDKLTSETQWVPRNWVYS